MIGTFTNVVAGGRPRTSSKPTTVKTIKVGLYLSELEEYHGAVEIPVDAINLEAAHLIVNSKLNMNMYDDGLMCLPKIQGVYPTIKVTTNNGKTSYQCSFDNNTALGRQKFKPSPSHSPSYDYEVTLDFKLI